jgi:hypothetical protein
MKIVEGEHPSSPEECAVHQFLSANSDLLTDRHKQKQVERIARQADRMHSVLEYDRLNIGKDITLTEKGKPIRRNRFAIVMKTEDEHAFAEIGKVLESVSAEEPYFGFLHYGPFITFLVSDNLKSTVFSTGLSSYVRQMNARHMIYHNLHGINLADCGLVKGPPDSTKEFSTYSQLFVLDWASQVLRDGSLMSPFVIPIKRELLFDALFGRKSIFVYFDRIQFAEFVNEIAAGKFILTTDVQLDREWCGLRTQIPGRSQKGLSAIGWGLIFRMLIEFQDPETVRRQMVEMVEGEAALERTLKEESSGLPQR